MVTIYCKGEEPPGMDTMGFISMNHLTASKPGLIAQFVDRWCDINQTIVIDEVCADNTIYQGEPFIGPRLAEAA